MVYPFRSAGSQAIRPMVPFGITYVLFFCRVLAEVKTHLVRLLLIVQVSSYPRLSVGKPEARVA